MSFTEIKEELRLACFEALENLRRIDEKRLVDEAMISELEYLLASYEIDHDPAGLYDKGNAALLKLNALHSNNPELVREDVMDNLKIALEDYANTQGLTAVHQAIEI